MSDVPGLTGVEVPWPCPSSPELSFASSSHESATGDLLDLEAAFSLARFSLPRDDATPLAESLDMVAVVIKVEEEEESGEEKKLARQISES